MKRILALLCFAAMTTALHAQTASPLTSWNVQAAVVPENVQMAGAVLIGDYIYLVGGNRTSDGDSDNVTRFYVDPVSGLVSAGEELTPLLPPPANPLYTTFNFAYINDQVVATASTIYIVGGGFNSSPNENRSDVSSIGVDSLGYLIGSAWSSAPLPTTPSAYAPELGSAVICSNGYLYCFGGDTNDLSITDECYYAKINTDGSLGTFTAGTTLPDPDAGLIGTGWWFSFAASIGDYIIASPGITDSNGTRAATNAQDDIYICKVNSDGSMGSWTAGPALPAPRYGSILVAAGTTIFCIGGRNNNADAALRPEATVWRAEFNPSTGVLGSWTVETSLPKTVYYHNAVYSPTTRRIYVLGLRVSYATAPTIDKDVWVSNELFAPTPTPVPTPTDVPPAGSRTWNLYN